MALVIHGLFLNFFRDILVWGTKPTVTIVLIIVSCVMVSYLRALNKHTRKKLNNAVIRGQLEYGDKVQILRSNGIAY